MINNIELNKQLCKEMPYLIPRNAWTGEIVDTYDYSYIVGDYDLPEGWNKLFMQMCRDIKDPLKQADLLETFRFMQVKEKYNTLRAYYNSATKEVEDIIGNYEYISQFVCSQCGKPATKETTGYVLAFCDNCYNKRVEENPYGGGKFDKIQFDPIRKYRVYSQGKTIEYHVDVRDIWNRLYPKVCETCRYGVKQDNGFYKCYNSARAIDHEGVEPGDFGCTKWGEKYDG